MIFKLTIHVGCATVETEADCKEQAKSLIEFFRVDAPDEAAIGQVNAAPAKDKAVEVKPEPAKEAEAPNVAPATDTTNPSGKASSEPAKEIAYDEVRALIITVSRAAKSKAEAMLARFGVKNGKELKPEQYAEFVEYATRVVYGEVDPEAGDA